MEAGELQAYEDGAGESAISVSLSIASRILEKASKFDLVEDFVRGGVWRLRSAGLDRKQHRGWPSSSDDSGVRVPLAEMRVVGLERLHCAKESVCLLVGEARNGRIRGCGDG